MPESYTVIVANIENLNELMNSRRNSVTYYGLNYEDAMQIMKTSIFQGFVVVMWETESTENEAI